MVAIHFLPTTDAPECVRIVHEYLREASAVAGVRHVFIRPGSAAAAKAWAEQFGDSAGLIYADPNGALAKDLEVPDGPAMGGKPADFTATVVVGADGSELFRAVSKTGHDHIGFGEFASRVNQATRHAALADYNLPEGGSLAVEGYDVVAYFTQNRAVKGKPELESCYGGVRYLFATEDSRRSFAEHPRNYLPTYGGWCASAMGDKGTKVEIDPTNFKVKDGRLFLFFRGFFGDALRDWNKHEKEWEPAADVNWRKLTGESPIKPTGYSQTPAR